MPAPIVQPTPNAVSPTIPKERLSCCGPSPSASSHSVPTVLRDQIPTRNSWQSTGRLAAAAQYFQYRRPNRRERYRNRAQAARFALRRWVVLGGGFVSQEKYECKAACSTGADRFGRVGLPTRLDRP